MNRLWRKRSMSDFNHNTYITSENYLIKGKGISRIMLCNDHLTYFNIPTEHVFKKDPIYQNIYHYIVFPKKLYICMQTGQKLICSGKYLMDQVLKVANCHPSLYATDYH